MGEDELELPQWVTDLLEKAYERGYDKGRTDGQRWQYQRAKEAVERTDPC